MNIYIRKRVAPFVIISIIIGVSGCSFLHNKDHTEYEPLLEEKVELPDIEYKTTTVKKGSKIEKKEEVFVLKSTKQEKLYFNFGDMNIEKILVEENDHVNKGDLIAQLELDDLEENLEKLQAQCETKKVELRHEKKLLEIKRKEVPFVKEENRKDFQKELKDIQSDIGALEQKLDFITEQIKKSQELKQQRCIYAPMNGYIKDVQSNKLDQTSKEKEAFATIYDDNIVFQNTSDDNTLFKAGQNITVYIKKMPYQATVTSVEKTPGKSEYITSIIIDSEEKFEEGTVASIQLKGEKFSNQLFLDSKAIFTLDGEEAVFTLDENGFEKVTKVQTGKTIDGFTVIKSGVKEGEQVVLE